MNPVEQPSPTVSIAAEPDPFEPIIIRLEQYARARKNCLLIGESGIGKTSLVLETARKLGLRLTYFSAPTLDPWADLIGVPVPREEAYPFTPSDPCARPRGGGGTSFDAIEQFARSRARYPDVVVVFTDGQAPRPSLLHPERWLWCLTPAAPSHAVQGLGERITLPV